MARHKPTRDECVTCGKITEPELGAHSLIAEGWRLTVERMPDEREVMRWRCPECARAYSSSKIKVTKA
jgi:hypothetical protein